MITSKQQKALDMNSDYFGVSVETLMENAGKALFDTISKKGLACKKVHVYAGPGNNGGDAFVAARHLADESDVSIFLLGEPKSELARKKYLDVKQYSTNVKSKGNLPTEEPDLILDGIFGTGIKGQLREPYKSAIAKINSSKAYTVSIDVPSGADPDTGKGYCVKSDLIITMHDVKPGFQKATKVDIGIPPEAEKLCGPGDIYLSLPNRKSDSHKGQNGTVLVIGGSEIFVGAPIMAALAAMRTGADGVILAGPERAANTAKIWPDLITVPLEGKHLKPDHFSKLQPFIKKADVILFGPGVGIDPETKEFALKLSKVKKPLVIDADGIKLLAKTNTKAIWTPHHKEFEILTGKKPTQQNVKEYAKKLGVILLKGQTDIISDGAKTKLNQTGNEGMTKFGTGDVLSGITAGLLAQNKDPIASACSAAFVNGTAGDRLFEKYGYGFLASDLLKEIPKVLYPPKAF
ncbi:NAD(P)H-hydrate dehydratase [Candidatus Undinarchaeota archaeon]